MALGGGLESLIPKRSDGAVPAASGGGYPRHPAPKDPLSSTRDGTSRDAHASSGWPHREEFQRQVAAAREPRNVRADASHQQEPAPISGASRHDGSVFHIEVEKIRPNPYQPRREFDDDELRELAASIREFGILQPLVVTKAVKETPTGTDVEYQLVAGERRLMAAKLAGLERVPVTVRAVDSHRAKLELALIENIQRSNLNPLEAARAYARLGEEFGLTQREVAARIGKSREVVANAVRLLNLPVPVQEALATGRISESQARTLLSLPTAHDQLRAFEDLLVSKVSVRALRERVAAKDGAVPESPEVTYWCRKLEEELGAPVTVKQRGEKGKLSIQFFSAAELRSIVERLLGREE
jgi:ParB family transcriptional regulator, chromosome partitioning protein